MILKNLELTNPRGTSRIIIVVLVSLTAVLMSSCVSFDSQIEGSVNEVLEIGDVTVYSEAAGQAMIAFAIRNDGHQPVKILLRGSSTKIGNNYKGGTGFASSTYSNREARSAFRLRPHEAVLNPGDELMMTAFLNNWYYANVSFTVRFYLSLDSGESRDRIVIAADQDDFFEDSERTFRLNIMGQNDTYHYRGQHYDVGTLPQGYSIEIPE